MCACVCARALIRAKGSVVVSSGEKYWGEGRDCSLLYKSRLLNFHNYVCTFKRKEKNEKEKSPNGEVLVQKINGSDKNQSFYATAYIMFF